MIRPVSSLNYNFTTQRGTRAPVNALENVRELDSPSSWHKDLSPTTKITKPACIASHHVIQQRHIIFDLSKRIVTDLDIESPPKVHLIPYRLLPSTCHPWRFTSTTAIPPIAGPRPPPSPTLQLYMKQPAQRHLRHPPIPPYPVLAEASTLEAGGERMGKWVN